VQAFGDEHDRRGRGDFARDEIHQQLFADAVNGIDRVAFVVAFDLGEVFERGTLTGFDNPVADESMQSPDRREQRACVIHYCFSRAACL